MLLEEISIHSRHIARPWRVAVRQMILVRCLGNHDCRDALMTNRELWLAVAGSGRSCLRIRFHCCWSEGDEQHRGQPCHTDNPHPTVTNCIQFLHSCIQSIALDNCVS